MPDKRAHRERAALRRPALPGGGREPDALRAVGSSGIGSFRTRLLTYASIRPDVLTAAGAEGIPGPCRIDPHPHVQTPNAVRPDDDGIDIQLADLREIIGEPGNPQQRIREPGGIPDGVPRRPISSGATRTELIISSASTSVSGVSRATLSPGTSVAAPPDPNGASGRIQAPAPRRRTPERRRPASARQHPQPRSEVDRQRPVALGDFLRSAQIDPDARGVGPVYQSLGLGLEHDAAAELRGGRGRFLLRGCRHGNHQRDAIAGHQLSRAGSQPAAVGRRARKPVTKARASAARSPSSSGTVPRCRPRQARYRTAWPSARAASSGSA